MFGSDSAFPTTYDPEGTSSIRRGEGGLTKREWFAGQALIGLLAHGVVVIPEAAARKAFEIADAILEHSK